MKKLTKLSFALLACAALTAHAQSYKPWMHSDVSKAWGSGYQGQGSSIYVVDQFSPTATTFGSTMTGTYYTATHGQWTSTQAALVAPKAAVFGVDYNDRSRPLPAFGTSGLNVVNASFGLTAAAGYSLSQISWAPLESSMIEAAKNGTAVVAKSAGNDAVALTAPNSSGRVDYLNKALEGAQSAIFVGALSKNGSKLAPATMASYSNTAGNNVATQQQFLVVGVESGKLGVAGTSFAAPIVSGYAAIVGSKFTTATPTQVANRLLTTARTDTIANYQASVHGRGEASLSRALAPTSIR